MPSIKIRCSNCNINLGEIRQASLRKNISYLCSNCEDKRKIAVRYMESKGNDNSSYNYEEMFGNIFGKKY